MKEVVLDTETTGISVKEGHRIVEIGCIELDNLIPTKNRFHCYLNPERKVSEKALEVHGYTDEFLVKQSKFKEVCDEFLNFIKDFDHNYILLINGRLHQSDFKFEEKNKIEISNYYEENFPEENSRILNH